MVNKKPQYRHALVNLGASDYSSPEVQVMSGKTIQGLLQNFHDDGYIVDQPVWCGKYDGSKEEGIPVYHTFLYHARLRD